MEDIFFIYFEPYEPLSAKILKIRTTLINMDEIGKANEKRAVVIVVKFLLIDK